MNFILASQSPRRRELLTSIGLAFDIVPSDVPEIHQPGESPEEYVARLSRDKAEVVAAKHPDAWIIAADTTVLLGDQLLEKPVDPDDAQRMLGLIAGKTHVVYSGVTLQNAARNWRETRVAESEVRMLPLDEREIEWYVSTGEPLDKAGAYAIQGVGAMFIDSIHGSYTNVVGLPLALLFQMLRRAGIDLTQEPGIRSQVS
ncbi:MAG: nucleoside triphosphate pyrophosphatase [Thermoanaerobaculia bacterium]|jgi:septum formation protein|nr:nucleoside triphosphate pyrophosphatase [Thermoanaerobaculia bacterium]